MNTGASDNAVNIDTFLLMTALSWCVLWVGSFDDGALLIVARDCRVLMILFYDRSVNHDL